MYKKFANMLVTAIKNLTDIKSLQYCPFFFDLAKFARLESTYPKLIKRIQKAQLLILDDFGLVQIDQAARNSSLLHRIDLFLLLDQW